MDPLIQMLSPSSTNQLSYFLVGMGPSLESCIYFNSHFNLAKDPTATEFILVVRLDISRGFSQSWKTEQQTEEKIDQWWWLQ